MSGDAYPEFRLLQSQPMSTGLAVTDAFCVVGPFMDRQPGQPYDMGALVEEHERLGIDRRLCMHAESRDGVPEEGNAAMVDQARAHDSTAVIWTAKPPLRFNAQSPEAWLNQAQNDGVAMAAMYPNTQRHPWAPWANHELYAALESARLPLVLDRRQIAYEAVYELARAYPRLPVVLWHLPHQDERLIIPLLDRCENVRIGLGTRFAPTDGIESFTARYGPGRLIFGSTWPMQSPGPFVSYVMYAEVDQQSKAAILSANVQALLDEVRWPVMGREATNAHS